MVDSGWPRAGRRPGRPAIPPTRRTQRRKGATATRRAGPAARKAGARKPPSRPASRPASRAGKPAPPAPHQAPRPRAEQPLGAGVGDVFAVRRLGIPPSTYRAKPQKGVREFSWFEFAEVVRDLAARISEKFHPDVVLGVAKGGIALGGALAGPLHADFQPVRVEKRSRDPNGRTTASVPDARGRAVLVVDDVCSTGRTLAKARELARRSGAREVRSAVLVIRPRGARPDWFSFETDEVIVFPWDYQHGYGDGPPDDPGAMGV
jgi:hypoxanthine phosphoribosyltransferase